MASGHRWNTAGDDLIGLVTSEYRTGGRLHWPTAIAASGFACGQMALMARESSVSDLSIVDSARVTALMHDGDVPTRTIWGYSVEIAKQAFGIDADTLPAYRPVVLQLGTRLVAGSYPALDVPLHLVPHETPVNAGPRLRRDIHAIAETHGIQGDDIAFALATATMKMIGTAKNIGVRDLTALALQCCVAGSRFAPVADLVVDPTVDVALDLGLDGLPGVEASDDDLPIEAGAVAQAMADGAAGGFGRRR